MATLDRVNNIVIIANVNCKQVVLRGLTLEPIFLSNGPSIKNNEHKQQNIWQQRTVKLLFFLNDFRTKERSKIREN